jgi:hypothetical protein
VKSGAVSLMRNMLIPSPDFADAAANAPLSEPMS